MKPLTDGRRATTATANRLMLSRWERTKRSQPTHSGRLGYRPALDGLRAVAIGAVVLYHATGGGATWGRWPRRRASFSCLAGFLITTLLVGEHDRAGSRVSLGAFYRRRAYRLLPALIVMLGVVLGGSITRGRGPRGRRNRRNRVLLTLEHRPRGKQRGCDARPSSGAPLVTGGRGAVLPRMAPPSQLSFSCLRARRRSCSRFARSRDRVHAGSACSSSQMGRRRLEPHRLRHRHAEAGSILIGCLLGARAAACAPAETTRGPLIVADADRLLSLYR